MINFKNKLHICDAYQEVINFFEAMETYIKENNPRHFKFF